MNKSSGEALCEESRLCKFDKNISILSQNYDLIYNIANENMSGYLFMHCRHEKEDRFNTLDAYEKKEWDMSKEGLDY